jgi:aspartate aminotransferase
MSETRRGVTPPRLQPRLDLGGQEFLMFVIDQMAYEYEKQYDDVIRLTLGKSQLPPAKSVVAAMTKAIGDQDMNNLVFPAGLPELRERIAKDYADRYGADIDPARVLVNVGTSSHFRNIFQVLAGPGDEVLLPKPYYPLYVICAELAGASVCYYDIDLDTFAIDVDELASKITPATKIVVLNSPGNPLGNVLSLEQFAAIDAAVDGRALILNDEIYANAYFDDEPFSAAQLRDTHSPIAITNGFSKGHSMYARRVGWAIVPQELVEPLTVIQHHTLLCTDPVVQFGGIAALDDLEVVLGLVAACKHRRDYTLEQFAKVADVDALPSRGGFYLTLECSKALRNRSLGSSLELAREIMKAVHVATVPGSDFGIPETLRLSFTSERYDEGIDRLVSFFTS